MNKITKFSAKKEILDRTQDKNLQMEGMNIIINLVIAEFAKKIKDIGIKVDTKRELLTGGYCPENDTIFIVFRNEALDAEINLDSDSDPVIFMKNSDQSAIDQYKNIVSMAHEQIKHSQIPSFGVSAKKGGFLN